MAPCALTPATRDRKDIEVTKPRGHAGCGGGVERGEKRQGRKGDGKQSLQDAEAVRHHGC